MKRAAFVFSNQLCANKIMELELGIEQEFVKRQKRDQPCDIATDTNTHKY